MSFGRSLWNGWRDIVRSTWRAYMVFGSLAVVAILFQTLSGEYNGRSWNGIFYDAGVALGLTFLAFVITALIFHYQVRRNTRWPGGGGKRGRS